ncbi:MAG: hypothetical protein C0619_06925 [Desulfuromonas sp.]|nr:MAG: hypothetical protein C0619_06925 [Desulfuromonas sp.]
MLALPGFSNAATKGLFFFDNFEQRIDFSYRYVGSMSEDRERSTRITNHHFEETYHMGIAYAVLGPNLFAGKLGVDAQIDQTYYSVSGVPDGDDSARGSRLLYDFSGIFLRYQPISVSFNSRSQRTYVSRAFASNYEQLNDVNGVSLNVKNRLVPFKVEFRQTKTETDGLVADYKKDNKLLRIDARHSIEPFSETDISLDFYDNRTEYSNDLEDYDLLSSNATLSNRLTWNSGGNIRRLSSRVRYREQEGYLDSRRYNWSEGLEWNFGRALIGMLSYDRLFSELEMARLLTNQVRGSLRHKFVEAFDTKVGFDFKDTEQDNGEERDAYGDISVSYRNKLPKDCSLNTNLYYRYGVAEQNFSSNIRVVIDETHTADPIIPIILDQQNVLSETILIMHADSAVRTNPFVENLDYQVDQVGVTTLISILPGSEIPEGATLLISYDYLGSARGEYEYSNRQASMSLKLFKAYRLYARYQDAEQEVIAGEDLFFSLNNSSRTGVVGFDGSWRRSSFGLEYENRQSTYEDRQSLEAFYQQAQRIIKGVLTTGVGNYYASIDPGGAGEEYWTNTLSATSKYLTPVGRRASLALYGRYANTRSKASERDDITCGLNFRHGYGKLTMTLDAEVDWRFIGDVTRREETLFLKLTRYL